MTTRQVPSVVYYVGVVTRTSLAEIERILTSIHGQPPIYVGTATGERTIMLLLHKRPPNNVRPTAEAGMWWAVIRQSAWDICHGHEQLALDSYEFLSTTGLWMLTSYFFCTEDEAIHEIAGLVRRYNARAKRPLPIL